MINAKEDICVATNELDQPISITKFTLDSENQGKFVYIQGGVHGGEVTLPIIKKLYSYLQKNLKSGKVVFVPFANPLSWQQKAYTYTVGKFNLKNGKDFNRYFGTDVDVNSKIANKILTLCEDADLTLDLHTAHNALPYTIFSSLKLMPFIKNLNIRFNDFCGMQKKYEHCFDYELTLKDVPSITIECGAHDEVNSTNTEQVVNGILNVLASLKMIDAINIKPQEQIFFTDATSIKAECGGIVNFYKNLGETFKKGEKLFEIISANLKKENICYFAKEDGILLRKSKTHIFCEHDEVLQVIYNKDAKNSL